MRITVVLCCLVVPSLGYGHHSRAEFDQEARELEGTLVRVLWRNPHPAFTIEVEENGQATTWLVEGWSSLYTFDRAGITRDRFEEGNAIKVVGLPSTRRAGRILGTHILLADGTEAILKRDADPYWGESRNLGGQSNWTTETRASVVNAAEEDRGIFRVWSYPSPNMQTRVHLPLTESAQAARAEFDQLDNYIMRCEQKGMPGSMTTPNPYEFVDRGGTITIRGYEGDVVRTVYMSDSTSPRTQQTSLQGLSVGSWENNDTLVIHTTRIDTPYLGMTGIPLGDDLDVVERYTLSEDQTRLDFKITATDSSAFTQPAQWEYYWFALGEEFGQYECDIH